MSEVKTEKLSPRVTSLQLGDSGDTLTLPSGATLSIASGATIANSGTATGFGGDNTPAFEAKRTTDLSISDDTMTKVTLNTEVFDTDGAFDPSTNYRFTVPSGEGGKYFVYAYIAFHSSHGGNDVEQIEVNVKKNGSTAFAAEEKPSASGTGGYGQTASKTAVGIVDLSASDYLELYGYFNNTQGSSYTNIKSATLGAYKLIGV